MPDTESVRMDPGDRDAFLGDGGTGVVSLSTTADEPPHSIPVSYGYDDTEGTFYFRLAVDPDGAKGDLAGRAVTFVVHGRDGDRWRSVVASGQLERTTDESVATASLEGLQHVHIPLVDIFGEPPREVSFEFYRLDPEELTAREESSTAL